MKLMQICCGASRARRTMRPRVCEFFHEKAAEVKSQPDGSETHWMLTHGQRELVWRCALVCLFLGLTKYFWRASGVESRTI
jgi:hypothetical protein